MKSIKITIGAAVLGGILAVSSLALAADHQGHTTPAVPKAQGSAATAAPKIQKLKPYLLKTCLVSDEKLGGMGDPYVHKFQDREIKFCCKGCLKDFNKEPAKFIKKLEKAEKDPKNVKAPASAPAHNHSSHQH